MASDGILSILLVSTSHCTVFAYGHCTELTINSDQLDQSGVKDPGLIG